MVLFKDSFEYDIHHSHVGKKIQEKFEIKEIIHRTNNSVIVKVYSLQTKEIYVLKAIKKNHNIQFEIELIKTINSKLINPLIENYESDAFIYLIENFVDGKDLQQYVEENGPFSEQEALSIINKIGFALLELHNNSLNKFIFRDLKPSNVMYSINKEIILIDVITIRTVKDNQTQDTFIIGSKGYTAPEAFGFMQTSIHSDIYSFGATFYYLLTGKHPYYLLKPETSKEAATILNSPFKEIIDKAMSFRPGDRFKNVEDFLYHVTHRILPSEYQKNEINTRLKWIANGISFKLYHNNDLIICIDRTSLDASIRDFKYMNCGTSLTPFTENIVEEHVYDYSFVENNGFEEYIDEMCYLENIRDRNQLFFSLYNDRGKPLAYYFNNSIREGLDILD